MRLEKMVRVCVCVCVLLFLRLVTHYKGLEFYPSLMGNQWRTLTKEGHNVTCFFVCFCFLGNGDELWGT